MYLTMETSNERWRKEKYDIVMTFSTKDLDSIFKVKVKIPGAGVWVTKVVVLPGNIHWACSRFKEVCWIFNSKDIA